MAGLTTDRDLNDLIDESVAEGFTIEKMGNGHLKWIPPNFPEAFFTCAATPKSWRIVEHVRLQKRRALAGYSEGLPNEMKQAALGRMAQQNQDRKDAKAALTANIFKNLLKPKKIDEAIVIRKEAPKIEAPIDPHKELISNIHQVLRLPVEKQAKKEIISTLLEEHL